MNVCAFCGPTKAHISEEDLFPLWLSRLLQRQFGLKAFDQSITLRHGIPGVTGRYQRMNARYAVVCRPCNTVWMSQIEAFVKPLITKMVLKPDTPITFTNEECAALIIWTAVKSVIADHSDVVATNSKPFFSPAQRTTLRDEWLPPQRTSMWIARLKDPANNLLRIHAAYSRFPRHKPLKHLHAFTFTISILEFAVQALFLQNLKRPGIGSLSYVPESAFRVVPSGGVPWSYYLTQLYPDVGAVGWPPLTHLGIHGFEALAYRVSGSPPAGWY